jgi:non-heme Fe2+,alpha-ketoglutarate-dependent halogenase
MRLVRKAMDRIRYALGETGTWLILVLMLVIKPFPFLHRFLPEKGRGFLRTWTFEMIRLHVFSFRRRMYIDVPATLPDPPTWEPRVRTAAPFRFAPADMQRFYQNGFAGPFTLCSREEMIELREKVLEEMQTPSTIYGQITGRDRHLDCERLFRLVNRPELVERCAQLLGPDLMLWRSDLFLKPPGFPEITWHQATTYISEEGYKGALYPPDIDKLWGVTVWIAFDDVDLENGCLQFLPGSHRRINTIHLAAKDGGQFASARVKMEIDIDPAKLVNMEMQAGQFVVFSERCVHGSPPNRSADRRRFGMAFRVVLPEVRCYSGATTQRVSYLEQEFNLEKWGAIVLRGTDTAGVNPILHPFSTEPDALPAVAAAS